MLLIYFLFSVIGLGVSNTAELSIMAIDTYINIPVGIPPSTALPYEATITPIIPAISADIFNLSKGSLILNITLYDALPAV